MALMRKPKQKLISVAGAQAKAKTVASRAKAVKPGKKSTNEPRRGGMVREGGQSFAKVYNRTPK